MPRMHARMHARTQAREGANELGRLEREITERATKEKHAREAAEVRMQAYWDDLRRAEARAERRRWRDKFGKAIIPGCSLSKESFDCRPLFFLT